MKYYNIYHLEREEREKIKKLKISYQENDHLTDLNNGLTDNQNNNINTYNNKYNNDLYNSYNYNNINQDSHEDNKSNNNGDFSIDKSIDCIIEIPDIDLSKAVYTGNNRESYLDDYMLITASSDMNYINGGNYIICGHASRLYGHSLNRLKEVHKGTLIRIWAKYGLDEYEVKKVYFEDMDKTSEYCKQTTKDEITIVSCAKYISVNSYIIVKAVKKQ